MLNDLQNTFLTGFNIAFFGNINKVCLNFFIGMKYKQM